ncbi:hypothetical protein GUJ93_ZPchr0001g30761 [Zizania palustris]|uniref:Uncharacterized protein n=1 Tax=Zizania palustris TaxID=103762 RepID=A0A8J5V7G4_ZIZPA|nr:hypothetical protein GUJ93_ZPchr0001g30761 [Zizania palustris]
MHEILHELGVFFDPESEVAKHPTLLVGDPGGAYIPGALRREDCERGKLGNIHCLLTAECKGTIVGNYFGYRLLVDLLLGELLM